MARSSAQRRYLASHDDDGPAIDLAALNGLVGVRYLVQGVAGANCVLRVQQAARREADDLRQVGARASAIRPDDALAPAH